MPFAPVTCMSKQNNTNPNSYKDGDRYHQGEGIVHEEHKDHLGQNKANQSAGKEGQPNFIPGADPVGKKKSEG